MNWYILKVRTQYERKVKKELLEKVKTKGFLGIEEALVPTTLTRKYVRGKLKEEEKVSHPSYLYVKMNLSAESIAFLRTIKHISGFATGGWDGTVPMSEDEVQRMLSPEKELSKTEGNLVEGDSIMITDGPFVNFKGTVSDLKGEKVKVEVLVFGKKTPVELSKDKVQKVV